MIELKNVSKIYPRKGEDAVRALDDISLTVKSGDIHGIVGESGAGKSTLIRCLTALERPTSGSILINNQDLTHASAAQLRRARRDIGMVFQGANLFDQRTAADNIAYPLKIAKKTDIQSRVTELLRVVGLSDRASSYPSQLSGGQRQRVAIARALAVNPPVLLCDEPTSALDTETTEQILELLRDVRDRYGVTILIITHEMHVVRRICDSVTLLDHGKVISSTSVGEAVSDPQSPLAKKIVPAPLLDPEDAGDRAILDVYFTSNVGTPTASRVLKIAAELGADIGAGTFDSIKEAQVARLALTIDSSRTDEALQSLNDAGVSASLRQANRFQAEVSE